MTYATRTVRAFRAAVRAANSADARAERAMHRRNNRDPIAPLNLGRAARITQAQREREAWRRISGITLGNEPYMDGPERKAGIGRIVEWMEERVKSGLAEREAKTTEPKPQYFFPSRPKDGTLRVAAIGCTTDWLPQLSGWARVAATGESVESICQYLGLSHGKLSNLVRELCGMSVDELIDGLKLQRLQHVLIAQLRGAARELWGAPGDLAEVQCLNQHRDGINIPHLSPGSNGEGMDWRELRDWRRDSNRRGGELAARLRILRGDGTLDAQGRTIAANLQALALKLGYASASRLKSACVSVFGQSLEEIEMRLAKEISYYYACAEERVLRETASETKLSPFIARARYLYHGDDDKNAPAAPFLDMWSLVAECQPRWTEDMRGMFG